MNHELPLENLARTINGAILTALRDGLPPEIARAALDAAQRNLTNALPFINAASVGERKTA